MTTRLWIWLGAAVVLGVGLGFVPLFGVLGFELALFAAGFAALAGLDIGASRAREAQQGSAVSRADYKFVRGTLTASGIAVAIACVPAVIAMIHGIWAPTCDW